VLISMSALSMALAIWTMHFVGMLAMKLPVAVDFLVLPTLLSFLICVLVVGGAVFAMGTGVPTLNRIGLAALLMGAGIVSMHYMGMYALHSSVNMAHDPRFVAAGIFFWGRGFRRLAMARFRRCDLALDVVLGDRHGVGDFADALHGDGRFRNRLAV